MSNAKKFSKWSPNKENEENQNTITLNRKNIQKNSLNCKNYREKCIPRLKKFINEKLKGCKVGH